MLEHYKRSLIKSVDLYKFIEKDTSGGSLQMFEC